MNEFADLLGVNDHLGDVMSDLAQQTYEEGLIQECRRWVKGEQMEPPSTEHIRVLLSWIDSLSPLSLHTNEHDVF